MKKILFFILLTIPSFLFASVIRDSEIEETITMVADPLKKKAGFKDLKIYLVQNNEINAFTSGGSEIVIYSGIINALPDPEVLRAVLAHEMGHIAGGHVFRSARNADNYSKASAAALILGIAGSAAIRQPMAGMVVALGGRDFARRSVLSNSRSFESSADNYSFRLLETTGNSASGALKLLEYINSRKIGVGEDYYGKTHPQDFQRIKEARDFLKKSKYPNPTDSEYLKYRFSRAAAKLNAFTVSPREPDFRFSKNKNQEIRDYYNSIIYFRQGDYVKSLSHMDAVLKAKPEDPYYLELKGQILYGFGKKESVIYYEKASAAKPKDYSIKLGKDIVTLNFYGSDPEKLKALVKDFKEIAEKEPDNPLPLFYLAASYDKQGNKGFSVLYSALFQNKIGNKEEAKKLARSALAYLKEGSAEFYKAKDIISATE